MTGVFERIGGATVVTMAARVGGAALGVVTQLLLARVLDPAQLGTVFLALAIAGVGSVVAAGGYPSVTVRFMRRYLGRDLTMRAADFVRSTRAEAIAISLLLVILLAGLMLVAPLGAETRAPLLIGLVALPAFVLLSLNGGLANALRRVDISYIPDILVRPALWLAGVAVMLVVGASFGAAAVIALAVVAAWLAAAGQALVVRPVVREALSGGPSARAGRCARAAALWRKAAAPMVATTLLTSLAFDIDALLLAPLLSAAEIAVFGIAFKIAALVAFAVHVAQQAALPEIADAFARRDAAAAGAAARRCGLAGVAASLAALAILALAGKPLLALFGSTYVTGYAALLLLALCPLVRAIAGPAAQVLVLGGRQPTILRAQVAGLAGLCVFNVMFVSPFGITGAAASMLAATGLWTLWLSHAARHMAGVRADLLPERWTGMRAPLRLERGGAG